MQEVEHRGLKIDEKLEQKLLESKAAFDEGMQKSEELRNLISQLDENHMDKDMAALYEQAQDMFDADKKLFQRFTTKDEQNALKNCQKALKKNPVRRHRGVSVLRRGAADAAVNHRIREEAP